MVVHSEWEIYGLLCLCISHFFTELKEEVLKIKIFKTIDGVYKFYGKENIIPITAIKQVIFYTSICDVQPVFVKESEKKPGEIAFFFTKEDTKECYELWMKARPGELPLS